MPERSLPQWPRRMKAWMAAAYVGESESKFQTGVKSGKWPQGVADGGNVYWYHEDLDDRLDALKTNGAPPCSDPAWQAALNG
jgi:hypothetical protein